MEDTKIKTSRASQTRVKEELKKVWTPPNSLDAPPAPTGYRHQWIRAEVLGQQDTKNVASAKRSASTGRRKTVKLTPSQVAIAKRLGVPLEDYAKQLKITEGA